jgi:beta-barrel assembly-enhancing protease
MFQRRVFLGTLGLALVVTAWAARKPGDPLKPGFNLFSKQDDVQIGQENSKQVLQQYEVVKNRFLQEYVQRIGQKLASAPEAKASGFDFTFTVLNVDQVNAFALPGGPMFIYTGLLKATDNEAQLAGVMGHEMSHVILRHGTHEATKANGISLLAGGIGAMLGGGGTLAGKLAQAGLGLGANSVILKFSRDAETEADALGSHLMAEAGYNPIQMAKFFEKLNASGGQQLQILSDHPNPGNRQAAIEAEMKTLPTRQYGYDSGQFARVKQELAGLPAPPKRNQTATVAPGAAVPAPSSDPGSSDEWKSYQGPGFTIRYPRSWQAFGESNAPAVTLAPRDGVVSQNGSTQIGFGAAIGQFAPQSGRTDLKTATVDLIRKLQQENAQMNVVSGPQSTSLRAGLPALATTMRSNSAFGGVETDTLVTVMRQQRLWYIVFIAPEKDQPRVETTFRQMLDSASFGQ